MKITISYIPAEQKAATADLEVLLQRHPGARVHKSDTRPPYKHIYLTTKKPQNPCGPKENA